MELELGKAGIRRALLGFVRKLRAGEAHLAVDQIAVRIRRKEVRGRGHDFLDNLFVRLMIPVAEHDRSDVVVIRCLAWAVDDHGSCDTSRVLSAVVGMVPRCSVNIREEGIGHASSRGNRALINSRNAIVPRRSLLQDSVPMHGSPVLGARDFITYVHGDRIAPISFNSRARELIVDKDGASADSIRSDSTTSDVEIVCWTPTTCSDCQHIRINLSGRFTYRC